MTIEQSIRDFVARFYAALNRAPGEPSESLLELWAHGPEATLLPRGGEREHGWEEVRCALGEFAPDPAPVALREMSVRLLTAEVAVVSALETAEGPTAPARCTLVVRRDAGAWRLVHRHLDAAPQPAC